MASQKTKVLVGLSGGVDSSVAALLLVKQGYEVTGAYMKQWSDAKELSGVCSWKEDRRDAMRVAAKLGIDFITLDFEKEYKEWVMGYMFKEYEAGRTPNPDVMCNKFIKFGAWLDKAKELGFDYLATGHYAKVITHNSDNITQSVIPSPSAEKKSEGSHPEEKYVLAQAKDTNKDQTYFLHQIGQEQLAHSMFPLGDLTKDEVRTIAKEADLSTANRAESMGICFVGEVPMKEFLQQKIKPTPGKIVTSAGDVMGEHEGLAFYTIGQRHIGTSDVRRPTSEENTKPLFVIQKRAETNELVVGYEDDPLLYKTEVEVENIHWIAGQAPSFPVNCKVRLRHRQELKNSKVKACPMLRQGIRNSKFIIQFEEPQRAVTPGQFAVLYKDGACLGGGVIS